MGIFAWRNNTMGVRSESGAYRPVGGMYGGAGSPDIIAILPSGKFLGIEIKAGGDRLRPAQQAFRAKIVEAGGEFLVIGDKNLLELHKYLEALL
jgi:hypothetical protein